MNIIYVPHKYPCDPLLCLPPSLPPSLIHPQETLICFLSYYFAFVEFSMTVITQYIVFVWLLSFSIIILRFVNIIYISSLFSFFFFCCVVSQYLDVLQFVYPLDYRLTMLVSYFGYCKFSSVQFISVSQLCLTLCDPMNRSTPGLPVHHQLPEFTQTHVH